MAEGVEAVTLAALDTAGMSEPSFGCGECPAACGYACWLRRELGRTETRGGGQ